MNDSKQLPLIDNAMALLSFRDSDFDAYSAYGEVVDNSIQANATNVKIQFEYDSKRHEPINTIAFGDDGDGMPKEIIHQCLQLGYSSRFNDRNGIGRFGVGATSAAINQCKKIEIYSKQDGKEWFYTYIDIDEITSDPPQMHGMPEPIKRSPPTKYEHLISSEQGTLVIWSKYDRQDGDASDIIEESRIWMGRTYRKFIWKGVNIYINEAFVCAIDPLYVTTEKTKFPNDPNAHEYDPIELKWPVAQEDILHTGQRESIITIRMSRLPEEFRKKRGTGGSGESKDRYIDRNEGISILRNDREVFYGHVPHWSPKFEEMDRWWGCEISFDAVLDSAFKVRNIKRGAVPVKQLKKAISDKINPTRNTIKEAVKIFWESQNVTDPTSGLTESGHAAAEKVAQKTPLPASKIDDEKNLDQETEAYIKNSSFLKNASDSEKAAWNAKYKSQPFTIVDDQWRGPSFFDAKHLGGKSILNYNTGHEFFVEISDVITKIESSGKNQTESEELKIMIDLLIMSFAKAEASFDKNMEVHLETFLDQLKDEWGKFLKSFIKTRKKELSKS